MLGSRRRKVARVVQSFNQIAVPCRCIRPSSAAASRRFPVTSIAVLLGVGLTLLSTLAARAATEGDVKLGAGAVSAHELRAMTARLRSRGCAGHAGSAVPLRPSRSLDGAARRWARGDALKAALLAAGYRAQRSTALHVVGDPAGTLFELRRECAALTKPSYRDLGVFRRGRDSWLILAAPFVVPTPKDGQSIAAEVLKRINAARSAARHCGQRQFAAAPPLSLNADLTQAAASHARDMLAHNYFQHRGSDGSTPAARVAATGYGARLVGENIAFGPPTVASAVAGWLASPEHCQNIMDPRFQQTGAAVAASRKGRPRIYWVEDFAQPR